MGKILKTNLSLRILASGASETKNSTRPFIIQEALLSPGCTLAEIKIPFFYAISSVVLLEVMVRYSHLFPARVLQRVFLTKKVEV